MRILLTAALAAIWLGALADARSPRLEFRVWAGSAPNVAMNRHDETYILDAGWRTRATSSDEWVLSRGSPVSVRLSANRGRWYVRVGDTWREAACNDGPFYWAITPSGNRVVCVDGNYPHQLVRILRPTDLRPLATIPIADGFVEGRNKLAFADDDRVLYAAIDDSCPREELSRLSYSIVEMSVTKPTQRHVRYHCASGVVVGTSQVGYLRANSTQYTIDGTSWVTGALYAFDGDDHPITDLDPRIQAFEMQHPGVVVYLISAGASPAHP
jgi:hypothetical protein